MRTLITKIFAFSGLALLMLASCQKEGQLTTVDATSTKLGTLTPSTTTLVLNSTKLTDASTVITFSFTQATFGYSAAVTNTLQLDAPGDNWANPYSVSIPTGTLSQAYNTGDFNALLLKMGLKGGATVQINARVQSALSATNSVYTNIAPVTVTPFNLKSWLYVPGAYEGWNNPGPLEDSLYSATSNGIYVGVINFTAGNNQFLITPAKNWNNKYATNDANNITSKTVAYNGPNNFYAPATPGQYLVTLNINANTISFALVDTYSIIGDAAQGWSTDVPLKYVNDGNGNWTSTLPLVSTGQFKIREDNDWTFSWGIPKSGSDGFSIANTLNRTSNDNIPVAVSGTYKVTFNAPYTLYTTTPPATPASTTAAYSSVKQ